MAMYHVWFSTKGRKPALVDEIGALTTASLLTIAQRIGVEVLDMAAGEDHVHLLLALNDHQNLSTVMHDLKGASARDVFRSYPELRLDMASNSFWQKGYGWRLVPQDEIEGVRRYIRTQSERPLRHV